MAEVPQTAVLKTGCRISPHLYTVVDESQTADLIDQLRLKGRGGYGKLSAAFPGTDDSPRAGARQEATPITVSLAQ